MSVLCMGDSIAASSSHSNGRRKWSIGRAAAVVLLTASTLTACVDGTDLITSGTQDSQSALQVQQSLLAPSGTASSRTLREEFADIARRVPGGFAGVMFDENGNFTLLLVDVSRQAAAKVALANEPFIRLRQSEPGGDRFATIEAQVRRVMYSYDQLYNWYDEVLHALPVVATMSGISVSRNKVVIGVAAESDRLLVENAVRRLNLPPDAILIEVAPSVVPLRQQTLSTNIRPVPGGVQVRYTASGDPWCTLGPNVLWVAPAGSQRAFLVNSHCTKQPFQMHSGNETHYYQAAKAILNPIFPQQHHIGNEAIDPPLFTCMENPNGCRNSDAALGLYASYAAYELSYIARPASRNTRSLTISTTQPRFQIIQTMPWSIDGEVIEKVGRTTGWTGGVVVDGCWSANLVSYTIRCAMLVQAEAGEGDSGSPAFRILQGTQVELRGTLFAGTGSCHYEPDPVYSNPTLMCTHFVANNLGGIVMDINPSGSALHFW